MTRAGSGTASPTCTPSRTRRSSSARATASGSRTPPATATSMRPPRSGTATSATAGARSPTPSPTSSPGCPAYSSFGAYTSEPTLALADRLAALAPIPNAVVFLGSGGSDAVDTAAKLVASLLGRRSAARRSGSIVSREFGYHGMHGWGTSLVGIAPMKAGYGGDFIDEVVNVGAMDVETLGALFARARPRDRGVHRRAGDRRRRRLPARADHYWPEVQPALPRARHPAHRRRGHHRASGGPGTCGRPQRYGIEPT